MILDFYCNKKLNKNNCKLFSPEYVADAFLLLVKECENGAVLAVDPKVKPFVYPDQSFVFFIAYKLAIKFLLKVRTFVLI